MYECLLLQQRLTEVNHPDHLIIVYPGLGHTFVPSNQWITSHGQMEEYVLADLYAWLESHSGFTHIAALSPHPMSLLPAQPLDECLGTCSQRR
jgi:hypothetical protein